MKQKTQRFLAACLAIIICITASPAIIAYAEKGIDDTPACTYDDSEAISYQMETADDIPERSGEGINALGYVEPNIDMGALLHKDHSRQKSVDLPVSYSLVSEGYVTSVKDQNPFGTCWTFATVGSAESGIKKKYGRTVDLAELQLGYFFYNCYQKSDPMQLITNDGNYSDDPDILDLGGSSFDSTYALASGIGFSDESDYPYTDAGSYVSDGTIKECYNATYRLRSARWLNMSEPEVIKQALMNYGALAVSFYHSDSYFNSNTNAYYQNYTTYSNHAVTLVGWDDDYSVENFNSGCRPTGNGAWLLKNSWGRWWGDNGYFWISYEDLSLQNSEAVFFEAEMGNDIPKNYYLYQYDGGGSNWRSYRSDYFYMANIFETASNEEVLTDVGFISGQSDTQYTIYIYTNVGYDPTSGDLVYTKSGSLNDAGYYLIKLDSPVTLSEGEKYAIVIKQSSTTNDTLMMYFDEDSSYGDVHMINDVTDDLSFSSYDGVYWDSLTSSGKTARIKAVTIKTNDAPTVTEARNYGAGILVEWDWVPGASGYVVYRRAMRPGETEWSIFARWNNTKELSFLDTKVYDGTKYQYGIKAYFGDDPATVTDLGPVGPMSRALVYGRKPQATTKLTVVNAEDGIDLSWDAVNGATGYVIYRRAWSSTTDGWTDFQRWNNTTSTEWTDTKVYAGSKYQYGIKAYYGSDPKNMAYIGSVGPLKANVRVTARKITNSTVIWDDYGWPQELRFEWDPSSLFTGYQIELNILDYSDEELGVKTIRITDKSVKTYTVKEIEYGYSYLFRVRSYYDLDGITYYGAWSEWKKVQPY